MKKICYIDDDMFQREMAAFKFEDAGYNVTTCGRTMQMIMNLTKTDYDVLVIDVHLDNNENGITFAEMYRSYGLKTPIVFFTSNMSDENIERSKRVSNSLICPKQTSFENLFEIIEKMSK